MTKPLSLIFGKGNAKLNKTILIIIVKRITQIITRLFLEIFIFPIFIKSNSFSLIIISKKNKHSNKLVFKCIVFGGNFFK